MLLKGKTALVTGAAHGQGRAHALRLAKEGADVVMLDVCEQKAQVAYRLGTWEELQETLKSVEAIGRRGHIGRVDVRDREAVSRFFAETAEEFPKLDIIVANAGISSYARLMDLDPSVWDETIAVNLTGVFNVVQVFVPRILSGGTGGSIIIASSAAGSKALPFCGAYTSAKHGLQGLSKALAQELGPHGIRVNTVNPAAIRSAMTDDPTLLALFEGDPDDSEWFTSSFKPVLPMPADGLLDPDHVADAVAFLASDAARYVTGAVVPVDAGVTVR